MEKESRFFFAGCCYLLCIILVIFSLIIQIPGLSLEILVIHVLFVIFYSVQFVRTVNLAREYLFHHITELCNSCEKQFPEQALKRWNVPFLEDPIFFCKPCFKQYRKGNYEIAIENKTKKNKYV